eukprot:gene11908-5313_t
MAERFSDMKFEEQQELLKKNLPEKQPGSKGWGLEGHKMENFGIFKDKKEDLIIKSESEYPEWLKTIFLPEKSLDELEEMKSKKMEMTSIELKRLGKLRRKKKIKENNARKGEGIWD